MLYTGPAVSVYCMIGYHCTTAWPTARWRFIKYAFNLPLLTTTLTLTLAYPYPNPISKPNPNHAAGRVYRHILNNIHKHNVH